MPQFVLLEKFPVLPQSSERLFRLCAPFCGSRWRSAYRRRVLSMVAWYWWQCNAPRTFSVIVSISSVILKINHVDNQCCGLNGTTALTELSFLHSAISTFWERDNNFSTNATVTDGHDIWVSLRRPERDGGRGSEDGKLYKSSADVRCSALASGRSVGRRSGVEPRRTVS